MDPNKKGNLLKLITLISALLGCALRAAHYAFGTDGRGLLVRNHWSVLGLWAVCVLFAAALVLLGLGITGRREDHPQPSSPLAAAGCFALGAALLISGLQNFGDFFTGIDLFIWALGLCAGGATIAVGVCRLTGKQPYFLLHGLLCLYITLRTVAVYRHWSADPQLQDYGFYLTAHAALMLSAYHHAAFDAALSGHRPLWLSSLAAVFLSCAALPRCEEKLLLAAFALWAFGNLTVLPVRKRRIRPTTQVQQP